MSQSSTQRVDVGDVIVFEGHHVGDSRRTGKIVEVLGEGEREHYRVRWEDGHETILYPRSSDATIKPARKRTAKAKAGEPGYEEPVLLHEP